MSLIIKEMMMSQAAAISLDLNQIGRVMKELIKVTKRQRRF
jgi:hypothetical protein